MKITKRIERLLLKLAKGLIASISKRSGSYWTEEQRAELRKRGMSETLIDKAEKLAKENYHNPGAAAGFRSSSDCGFATRKESELRWFGIFPPDKKSVKE